MPKPGYASITLRKEVVKLLKQRAEEERLGLNELLLKLLEKDRPGTVPSIIDRKDRNNPSSSFFSENNWCGGWDLNPRRPTPQGSEPCALDQAWLPPPSSKL